jgi:hypothetical protein
VLEEIDQNKSDLFFKYIDPKEDGPEMTFYLTNQSDQQSGIFMEDDPKGFLDKPQKMILKEVEYQSIEFEGFERPKAMDLDNLDDSKHLKNIARYQNEEWEKINKWLIQTLPKDIAEEIEEKNKDLTVELLANG